MPDDLQLLPREQRISLCRDLLTEFNAQRVSLSGDELIHSCTLPLGMHAHGDRNPSAALNVEKLVYSCFVCGGGSLQWWVATCRKTGTHQARQWLEGRSGTDGQDLGALLRFFDAVYNPEREHHPPMPTYSEKILDQWAYLHPYMTEVRRVPVETLKRFHIGWDPAEDRIVIPHFWSGDLVGWSSRRLASDGSPKYRHTPGFPKDQTIYNYDPGCSPVVVESPLSVLARHHHHPAIEATFGATLTPGQVRLLARHFVVTLFFDPDEAGWRATRTVAENLLAYTDVRVVENPWSADAADLSDADFEALVASAVPYDIWRPEKAPQPYERAA